MDLVGGSFLGRAVKKKIKLNLAAGDTVMHYWVIRIGYIADLYL